MIMTNVIVASSSCHCHKRMLFPGKGASECSHGWRGKLQNASKWWSVPGGGLKSQSRILKAHVVTPSTFSLKISTDIPFHEAPEASFDQYIEDRPRVFEAIFPEKQASEQLNEEEWRIHMLPIQSPFRTVQPVVHMRLRCNSNVSVLTLDIPHKTSKVLELDIIRSELQGLDAMFEPSQFSLGVQGIIYCDRRGKQSRLKGQMQLSMSFALPPLVAIFAENVCRDATQLVLRNLAGNLKQSVNASLLSDYSKFKKERLKKDLSSTVDHQTGHNS